jgi:hypothetical protein
MNKLLITLVFSFFLLNSYSQDHYIKLPFIKIGCPTIILENNIIANETALGNDKELIKEISVLKDKPNRKEAKYYNLTENGILFVSLKIKTAFKTQPELNVFFGIDKSNQIYVNGYLLESPNYKVATESIIEIELIEPNADNKLKDKIINVWTLTKKERVNGCKMYNLN